MPRSRFTLEATPATVRAARRRIAATVRSWGVPLCEDQRVRLELVASELLTNGLLHAGGRLAVDVVLDEHLLVVEVSDRNSALPRRRRADPDAEGGRGLAVLGGLCVLRGAEGTETGKRCFAVVDLNAPVRHGEAVPLVALARDDAEHERWSLTPAGGRLLGALLPGPERPTRSWTA
ncbi:ATP-binding protein [Streptomyces sp. NPDC048306]|uniref:ATP-binding protein n=1 Tax=Streptomyces sp. NPDC048306 TaxID=3154502 RepID=UPI00340CEB45